MSNGMTSTPLTPSYTRGIGYQAGLLGGMAMLVSIVLMLGEHGTRDDINARIAEDRSAMLNQVLPQGLYDNNPLETVATLEGNPFGGDPSVFLATRGDRSGIQWRHSAADRCQGQRGTQRCPHSDSRRNPRPWRQDRDRQEPLDHRL